VIQVVVVEPIRERGDRVECRARALELGQRQRAVQCDDRCRLEAVERVIEPHDGSPWCRCPRRRSGVRCQDRGLQLVRPRAAHPLRTRQQRDGGVDRRPVPSRAVLVGQQHERPIGADSRVAACQVEPHQRQQAEHLWLVRHESRDE
jgi:hypothetical protein